MTDGHARACGIDHASLVSPLAISEPTTARATQRPVGGPEAVTWPDIRDLLRLDAWTVVNANTALARAVGDGL